MLFLKYLDDLEHERVMEAELVGKTYEFNLGEAHHPSREADEQTAQPGPPDKPISEGFVYSIGIPAVILVGRVTFLKVTKCLKRRWGKGCNGSYGWT